MAKKICESLGQSYKIHGHEVSATPSIGIACAPDAGQHVDPLLKAADIAMYRAKAEGRNQFIFYSEQLHREVMDRVALEHNLRSAVEKQDFSIVYQPKVDLRNGEIVELEALLRWTCPSRGPVGPDEFIPVLERTGLINPVGAWVVEQVCHQLVSWRDSLDRAELAVSINLSVKQIAQEQRLVDHIGAVLKETGLEPSMLEFEITESLLMNDPQSCIQTLESLRELGARVVIDDFGTGFSSLQYLRTMPLHGLKIDKTFVSDLPGNTNDVAIVKATVALAQSLGLIVTAEGVETEAQAEFLTELGCDLAQGYYFARPLEPERIPDLLLASADELPELARQNARRLARKFVAREKPYQIDTTSTIQLPYFDMNRTRH
ncbi:MAG: GGDEF domain-containing phosphodiesterase [Pseudomonadota bacterium]